MFFSLSSLFNWFSNTFLTDPAPCKQDSDVLSSYRSFIISNIQPTKAAYKYEGEASINPAYQDIDSVRAPLKLNEKRIWALREDMILAIGVKNAYQKRFNYQGFAKAFREDINLSEYMDLNDRFGHPSLTLNGQDEELEVYYAGYLSQGESSLKISLASGRYFRKDLSAEQINTLESYLTLLFQKAYGNQDVIFYHGMLDYNDYPSEELYYQHFGVFFMNRPELEEEPKRVYPAMACP